MLRFRNSQPAAVLLATLLVGSLLTLRTSAHSYDSMPGSHSSTPLKPFAEFLADVADRPRRVIYTPYAVSPRHGLVQGFVHVTDGSAVLTRSDLSVDGLMPIVIRRAYHSARQNSGDFGVGGWRLTAAEAIVFDRIGAFAYTYGNGRVVRFDRQGRIESPLDANTTDVLATEFGSASEIRIRLRHGITKYFRRFGSTHLLDRVTDAFGSDLRFSYDANGRIGMIVSLDGRKVLLARDDLGRVSAVTDHNGRFVRYQYDDSGRLVTVTDIGGHIWTYRYDSANHLIETVTPNGETDTRFEFDNMARVRASYANYLQTTFEYIGLTTVVTDHLGRKSRFVAAPNGMTRKVINVYGNSSELELDREGLPIALKRNSFAVARIENGDPSIGQTSSVRLLTGNSEADQTILYDNEGRVIEVRGGVGNNAGYRVEKYLAGLIPGLTKYRDGTVDEVTLDAHGELTIVKLRQGDNWRFERSESEWAITKGYSPTALLRFDHLGQLAEIETPNGPKVEFQYEDVGLREALASSDGARVHYWYDASGNLFYSSAGYAGSAMQSHTYVTGPGHRLEAIESSSGDTHGFAYYPNGLLETFESPLFADPTFFYDEIGRLTRVEFEGLTPLIYTYSSGEIDIVSQLTVRSTPTFNQQREHTDFGSRFDIGLSRLQPSTHGALTYNDTLQEIVVAADPSRWTPISHIAGMLRAFRLAHLFEEGGPNLAEFTMPSNRLFVPREYWSVNCCICYCEDHTVECNEP